MRRFYRYFPALVAILMLAGATAAHADTFPYRTLDYPGSTSSYGYGINNSGQIVGSYNGTESSTARGYVYSNGIYSPVDYPGIASGTTAYGINNAGKIVGMYKDSSAHSNGFLLNGNDYSSWVVPNSQTGTTYAQGINDTGQIVGCVGFSGIWHGYFLSGGAYTTLHYGFTNFAYGNNDAGQIVGTYTQVRPDGLGSPWTSYGFLRSASGAWTTINFPGARNCNAGDINNLGQMVGSYQDSAGIWHGFSYDGQTYTSLDIPGARHTWAWGINDNGNFVGSYQDSAGKWHGFVSLATTWDLTADFSATANPNGAWSYGYELPLGGAFNLYNNHITSWAGWLLWDIGPGDTLPNVAKNITAFPMHNVQPGEVTLHPGGGGEHSVVRWTSPVAGTININGCFGAGDSSPMNCYIYQSGTKIFSVLGTGSDAPFSLAVNVSPGSTIDFAVGGYYSYGNTPLHAAITYHNVLPIANAGSNQTVHPGATVTLDGSGSNDPGGNVPLTYAWKFTAMPDGSTAALDAPTSMKPQFVADKYNAGDWVLELVVTNSLGVKSTPATVTISTSNSAPVADAGPDQAITLIGSTVNLDGTQSSDTDDFLASLTFAWSFTDWPGKTDDPALPAPTLSDPGSQTPSFIAARHGDYELQLTVTDPWGLSSTDKVKISFENLKPVANAGTNQSVVIGATVTLDGSASTDANGDLLTYKWTLASKPADSSQGGFVALDKITPFTPDVPGDYVAQLIVNDGFVDSDAATVNIYVAASRSWVSEQLRNVIADLGNKDLLPDDAFKNKNMRNTLITKLNVIIKDVDAGNYAEALAKLQEDVMAKTDGCAEGLPPAPDKNDWIVTCTYQSLIYPELQDIVGYLTELAK